MRLLLTVTYGWCNWRGRCNQYSRLWVDKILGRVSTGWETRTTKLRWVSWQMAAAETTHITSVNLKEPLYADKTLLPSFRIRDSSWARAYWLHDVIQLQPPFFENVLRETLTKLNKNRLRWGKQRSIIQNEILIELILRDYPFNSRTTFF